MTLPLHVSMACTGLLTALFSAGAWFAMSIRTPRLDRSGPPAEFTVTASVDTRSPRRDSVTA